MQSTRRIEHGRFGLLHGDFQPLVAADQLIKTGHGCAAMHRCSNGWRLSGLFYACSKVLAARWWPFISRPGMRLWRFFRMAACGEGRCRGRPDTEQDGAAWDAFD